MSHSIFSRHPHYTTSKIWVSHSKIKYIVKNCDEKIGMMNFRRSLGTWPNSLALRRLVTDCDSVKLSFLLYLGGCCSYMFLNNILHANVEYVEWSMFFSLLSSSWVFISGTPRRILGEFSRRRCERSMGLEGVERENVGGVVAAQGRLAEMTFSSGQIVRARSCSNVSSINIFCARV